MDISISNLFLYFSLGLVILWTVRSARSKGQNPWLWGGASLLLMFIPNLELLGMIPMVVLLFFRGSSRAKEAPREATIICPKCSTHHAAGHNFCVNCGWQLDRPFPQETSHPVDESSLATAATTVEPISQEEVPAEAPAPVLASEQTPSAEEVIPAEEPPPPPVRKPVRRLTITAASMTERGIALFTQGRIQEAVDQFTKAIALDPDYQPAWAQRAEAYLRLGLSQKAEEDQRRLKAI